MKPNKRNHAIFYDDLVEKVQKDIELHLAQIGSQEAFAVPLTRSTVLQWIDYIEVGYAGSEDDSTCRNQVAVHYIEAANDKQKWRARNLGKFYGW